MNGAPRGPQAARLGQRKFDLLPGAVTRTDSRCGKPACRCADSDGRGHVAWSLTFVSSNKHRVERIPKQWAETVAEPGGRIEKVKLDLL